MEIEDYRVTGYICETDFRHELGYVSGGVTVYSSLKDIKKHCSCAESCGVVKIECRYVESALKGNFDGISSEDVENKTPTYIEWEKRGIEHLRKRAAFFESQAKNYLAFADRRETGLNVGEVVKQIEQTLKKEETIEGYLNRIAAACGNPDPAEGCRIILKLVEEAKRVGEL